MSFDPDVTLFVIPDTGEKKDYSVETLSYFLNGIDYYVKGYDLDEYLVAKAVVCYQNPRTQTVGLGSVDTNAIESSESALFILDKVTTVINEDGANVSKIYGIYQGKTASYELIESEPLQQLLSGLKRGDALHFVTNGKAQISKIRIVFKQSDPKESRFLPYHKSQAGGDVFKENLAYEKGIGKLVTYSNARQKISLIVNASTKAFNYPSGNVYVCEGDTVKVGNLSDLEEGDVILYLSHYVTLRELVIYKDLRSEY
jgi:hypothetical protein